MVTKKKKKVARERIFRDGKYYTKRGVELTRCNNTMTEAEFFAFILSHCRRITQKWAPANTKMDEAKRPYTGKDKRIKYEYQCEVCLEWYRKASKTKKKVKIPGIERDHIIPCGGINCFGVIPRWFERALVEKDGYQRICTWCHDKKTKEERK